MKVKITLKTLFTGCGGELAPGHVVLGGHGGVQHGGEESLPPLCLGPHPAATLHCRLQGSGLCSTGKQETY